MSGRTYLWSASSLRNGVADWQEITPQPLQNAVDALRRNLEEQTWKVSEVMRKECHSALHKGMAEQARPMNHLMEQFGYSRLPTVDELQTEPAVFSAYFYRCAGLLAQDVRNMFSELLEISLAQSALIGRDPVDWAKLLAKVLVANESHLIPIWTKSACDVQPLGTSDDFDEAIHWEKWRAPNWFFMKPFANRIYDRATAWERMDEPESKHVLGVVEDRFNQQLIMELDKAAGEAHIRLAKRGKTSNASRPPEASAEQSENTHFHAELDEIKQRLKCDLQEVASKLTGTAITLKSQSFVDGSQEGIREAFARLLAVGQQFPTEFELHPTRWAQVTIGEAIVNYVRGTHFEIALPDIQTLLNRLAIQANDSKQPSVPSESRSDVFAIPPQEKKADTQRPKRRKRPANKRKLFVTPLRKKKGLSIHDWANKAHVDFHTANDYLRGRTNPHPSTRKKLADALGVEVEKLPR